MSSRQRTRGRQVMWSCKPIRSRLSETKLICWPSSCRHAGKRLHGCAAGCASCSKINMPGTVQLPEQLLCHPVTQLRDRLCSSTDRFISTYVHHLLLHEVNTPPLQLHICMSNEIAAASRVPHGIAIHSASILHCSLMCNCYSVLIVAVEQFIYCVAEPAFCFEGIEL